MSFSFNLPECGSLTEKLEAVQQQFDKERTLLNKEIERFDKEATELKMEIVELQLERSSLQQRVDEADGVRETEVAAVEEKRREMEVCVVELRQTVKEVWSCVNSTCTLSRLVFTLLYCCDRYGLHVLCIHPMCGQRNYF